MKVRIYTHAFCSDANDVPAGWSFIACEDVNINGDVNMQVSGCTKTNLHTARAMAILQALYFLRERKIKEYCIYTADPSAVANFTLSTRISDMNLLPGSILTIDESDSLSELNESLAIKAWYKIVNEPHVTFEGIDVGDMLVRKKELWSENHVVMAKSEGTKTLILKNLSTLSKRVSPWTKAEFDNDTFILMK